MNWIPLHRKVRGDFVQVVQNSQNKCKKFYESVAEKTMEPCGFLPMNMIKCQHGLLRRLLNLGFDGSF